jgi:molecular chaperone Hsp33
MARLLLADPRPNATTLLGNGAFAMTIDQGPDMDRYQGVTPLEGGSLARCAEIYFDQSEQTPTRVSLAVGRADLGEGPHWRAGGLLIQNIAEDAARTSTTEAWNRAQAYIATVEQDELIDPSVAAETLLYRLFNEDGVRLFSPTPISAFCRCSPERIAGVLEAFPPEEREAMREADGRIRVTCEYCSRVYEIAPGTLGAAVRLPPRMAQAAGG